MSALDRNRRAPVAPPRAESELLSRPDLVKSLGELASAAVRQISGASGRNVDQIERLMGNGAKATPRPAAGCEASAMARSQGDGG